MPVLMLYEVQRSCSTAIMQSLSAVHVQRDACRRQQTQLLQTPMQMLQRSK